MTAEQCSLAEQLLPMALAMAGRDDDCRGTAQLALCEAIVSYDGRLPLDRWARLCVQNALSHHKRRERRLPPVIGPRPAECPDLCQVIAALPESLRPLAESKWLRGESDQTARAVMGCSWAAYKAALTRARGLALKFLEDQPCDMPSLPSR